MRILTLLALLAAPAAARPIPLAVTLDDLPFVGPTKASDTVPAALGRIIQTVTEREVPAVGFFTCDRLKQGPETLATWHAAGLAVANHSTTHTSFDDMTLDGWVADVRGCRDRLAAAGAKPTWFRYPFLQTGKDRAARGAGFAALAELGHRRAPVTIDVADWVLAEPYAEADEAGRQVIAAAYVRHVRRAARHAREVARARYGREVAHVLLLHANAVAADHLGKLLDGLKADGFRFAPLDEVIRDPVYAEADDWVDPVGASWLYRTAPALPSEWAWDQAQVHALKDRFVAPRAQSRVGRGLRARRIDGLPAWVIDHQEPISANSLVYLTPEGAPVLVDTPWTPAATRDLMDWVETRFGRPLAMAVLGHYHLDATGGVAALRAANVPVIASDQTAALLKSKGPGMQTSLAKDHGAAFSGWSLAAPSRTFSGTLDVPVGGTTMRLIAPGHAHAPDNIVAWFPNTAVLFGGCMVKGGDSLGYLGDADVASYPAAIRALKALKPRIVVPGHGPRLDPEQLDHTLSLLAAHPTE